MSTTIKIKRPKFYDYFTVTPDTTRTCSHSECESPAVYVNGYYLVENRRVREWVCLQHWSGNPQLVLPTPRHILIALKAEEEFHEEMRKRYTQNVDPERGVSVKVLASSGSGPYIHGDRVANWRWGA